MGNYISSHNKSLSLPAQFNQYGWKPDLPDHRDKILKYPRARTLPSKVDLRDLCPPVYNQNGFGTSTICAVLSAYQFNQKRIITGELLVPSRLFTYYNVRSMNNSTDRDSGSSIRDCIKAINKYGMCPESLWTYDASNFFNKPHLFCYDKAAPIINGVTYHRIVQNHDQIKSTLADGQPIIFGMSIFPSFISKNVAETGVIPMPDPDEAVLGGHAALLVGYDDEESCWIVLTSWGDKFGDKGFLYLPYDYFFKEKKYVTDLWVLK